MTFVHLDRYIMHFATKQGPRTASVSTSIACLTSELEKGVFRHHMVLLYLAMTAVTLKSIVIKFKRQCACMKHIGTHHGIAVFACAFGNGTYRHLTVPDWVLIKSFTNQSFCMVIDHGQLQCGMQDLQLARTHY